MILRLWALGLQRAVTAGSAQPFVPREVQLEQNAVDLHVHSTTVVWRRPPLVGARSESDG